MFTTQQSIALDRSTKQRARKFRQSLYSKLLETGADSNAALLASEAVAAREVLGKPLMYNQGVSNLCAEGIDLTDLELLTSLVWQEMEPPAESTGVISPSSDLTTLSNAERQKLKETIQELERLQAKRKALVNSLPPLPLATSPQCKHPSSILPQQEWEKLNQDQLLSWVQVAISSFRQGWSLWETMLEYEAYDYLGFDDDQLMLSKVELLEIATWALNRAFKEEVA